VIIQLLRAALLHLAGFTNPGTHGLGGVTAQRGVLKYGWDTRIEI